MLIFSLIMTTSSCQLFRPKSLVLRLIIFPITHIQSVYKFCCLCLQNKYSIYILLTLSVTAFTSNLVINLILPTSKLVTPSLALQPKWCQIHTESNRSPFALSSPFSPCTCINFLKVCKTPYLKLDSTEVFPNPLSLLVFNINIGYTLWLSPSIARF